ncbi:MAG: Rab family GTPase [Candidatus Helarchaeales archaeon]
MGKKKIFLKAVLIGDGGVGKTSLLIRHVDKTFSTDYKPTLGFDISLKTITVEENQVELLIWDVAGQSIFKEIRQSYLEGSHCALLVYDITNHETFENIELWLKELKKYAGDVPFILVGNKIDLQDNRLISEESGRSKAEELGAVGFFETSAKTGDRVDEAFNLLTSKSIEYYQLVEKQ